MIFCSKCFQDPEIVSIINRSSRRGTCPVCGCENIPLYDSELDDDLVGLFDNFLSVYTPQEDLPVDYPSEDVDSLAHIVSREWDIFSDIGEENIIEILKILSPEIAENMPTMFTGPVGIAEKYDIEYLKKHSILRAEKWSDFVESIKRKNRFHTNLINTKLLKDYCIPITKTISDPKIRFYRGRIASDENGYKPSEMGAPPAGCASDGRANSAGISRLYLSYDRETTYHEIRAAEFDYVTIGTFKANGPIKVVDLKQIDHISPFNPDVECTALAINREHLQKINMEMGKTMRRGDSAMEYLPTQYIADFVMSIEDDDGLPVFDGIEFQSAMRSSGANLAIFYPNRFKCTFTRTYEVKKLTYHKKIAKLNDT